MADKSKKPKSKDAEQKASVREEGEDDKPKSSHHSQHKSRRHAAPEDDSMNEEDTLAMRALITLLNGRRPNTAEELGIIPLAKPVTLKTEKETYSIERIIGSGSFGAVLAGTCESTGVAIALKRVLQDKRYKNRELSILKMLDHPCVVRLIDSFYSQASPTGDVFLNVVMDYLPCNLHEAAKTYIQRHEPFPRILIKVFGFQMFRALTYLHAQNLCHRDIKPQNILCDVNTGEMRMCDFGSAKILNPDEPNVSYICSRFYRAPELILGACQYTTAVDVWSVGCVLAELFIGRPIFMGDTNRQQIQMIMRIIGSPTRDQVTAMNKDYPKGRLPDIPRAPWSKVFRHLPEDEPLDVIEKILVYDPNERPKAAQLLLHPWFADMSKSKLKLPSGEYVPSSIFEYSETELKEVAAFGPVENLPAAKPHTHKRRHAHKRSKSDGAALCVSPHLGISSEICKEAPEVSALVDPKDESKKSAKEKSKEKSKEASKEKSKDGSKSSKKSHKSTPKEPTKETPKEPTKETPKEPAKESPKEAKQPDRPKQPRRPKLITSGPPELVIPSPGHAASGPVTDSPPKSDMQSPPETKPKMGTLRRLKTKLTLLIPPSNTAVDSKFSSSLTSPWQQPPSLFDMDT